MFGYSIAVLTVVRFVGLATSRHGHNSIAVVVAVVIPDPGRNVRPTKFLDVTSTQIEFGSWMRGPGGIKSSFRITCLLCSEDARFKKIVYTHVYTLSMLAGLLDGLFECL